MTPPLIRAASPEDAVTIAAIWRPVVEETAITFNPVPKTAADVLAMQTERAANGHAFLVAQVDGAVLGFAYTTQFRGGAGYAYTAEHTIVLAPQARGAGLGRALMDTLCDHGRGAGWHSLIAGVSAENPAGVAFHEACGFARIARLPQVGRKFDRWIDLIMLQKMLATG